MVLLVIARRARRAVSLAIGVLTGAVMAQVIARLIWDQGVPDYLHVPDAIINAADICIIASVAVILACFLLDVRRKVVDRARR